MNALLEAYKVTKTYEKAQHLSLKNVSFTVAAGEFIGIMGASGSGKTTLLNVLSTIDTPSSGGQRQRASAASFADRILIFKDGRIMKELFKQENNRHDFYESIAAEVARLDTER